MVDDIDFLKSAQNALARAIDILKLSDHSMQKMVMANIDCAIDKIKKEIEKESFKPKDESNKHYYFSYRFKLERQAEGGYLVQFFEFPEAITQGETKEEAFSEAIDCLEEALANRFFSKIELPKPIIQEWDFTKF